MRSFQVCVEVMYYTYVTVEAEDYEEALDIAESNYHNGEYDDQIREAVDDIAPDEVDFSVHPF